MTEQPPRLVKRPRVNTADRIAHLVGQHERHVRRDRSIPVWIRVKMAGEEGGDVVGKVQLGTTGARKGIVRGVTGGVEGSAG